MDVLFYRIFPASFKVKLCESLRHTAGEWPGTDAVLLHAVALSTAYESKSNVTKLHIINTLRCSGWFHKGVILVWVHSAWDRGSPTYSTHTEQCSPFVLHLILTPQTLVSTPGAGTRGSPLCFNNGYSEAKGLQYTVNLKKLP